jgi:hypothetical protein
VRKDAELIEASAVAETPSSKLIDCPVVEPPKLSGPEEFSAMCNP